MNLYIHQNMTKYVLAKLPSNYSALVSDSFEYNSIYNLECNDSYEIFKLLFEMRLPFSIVKDNKGYIYRFGRISKVTYGVYNIIHLVKDIQNFCYSDEEIENIKLLKLLELI